MIDSSQDNQARAEISHSDRALLLLSAVVTALALGWILWYCRYGVDFTDDAFYVVWMSNPFIYDVSLSQFGFVYHPLYVLLEGNIAALRQSNVLITFGLASILSTLVLNDAFGVASLRPVWRLALATAMATAGLTAFVFAGLWLPTPSYNSLAMQAVLLTAIGLLLASRTLDRASILGWLLIGTGGWLAFMAKPTTAAGLGVCAGFYLIVAGKLSVRLALLSVGTACGLLIISAMAIDGSISGFTQRLREGMELARMLDPTYGSGGLLRLDMPEFDTRAKGLFVAATLAIFLAVRLSQVSFPLAARVGTALSLAFALISLAIVVGMLQLPLGAGRFQGLLLSAVLFASLLAGVSLYGTIGLFRLGRLRWAAVLTFLLLPYVYAFGTGNNYWIPIACAGLFFVLAGVVLLTPASPARTPARLLAPLGLGTQLIAIALIHSGMETPYRQPQPLRQNDYQVDVGRPGSTLVLSQGFGRYIEDAVRAATEAGFVRGTPIIDLTGGSPGVLYVLGATNIGQAWIIGGYPGSKELAEASLRLVPCDQLSRAWLLMEPDGPIRIPAEVLSGFGADVAADFALAGSFSTAPGAGGHDASRVQQLWKPTRPLDAAVAACAARRA